MASASSPTHRVAQALVGGFLVVFGSRLSSGCTSGHGISGVGYLSVNSFFAVRAPSQPPGMLGERSQLLLAQVGAMFAGGVCTAFAYYY